jgi:hypothetical protein
MIVVEIRRARFVSLGFALAIASCGARSELELSGAGGTTTASSAAVTNGSTVATTSVSTTTSVVATTSTGPQPVCGFEPMETLAVAIDRYNGMHAGCAVPTTPNGTTTTSFNAAIVSSDSAGHVVLDECSPAADCTQLSSKLSIAAKNIGSAQFPIGAFVEVRLTVHNDELQGCRATLQVKNLPSWAGAPNPVMQGNDVIFAGSNADEAFADGGYTAIRIPLGCYPNQMGCSPKDDDVYRVTVGAKSTDVPMGTSAEVGAPTWVFTNLQSFTTGYCDDPPHAAYLLYVPQLD